MTSWFIRRTQPEETALSQDRVTVRDSTITGLDSQNRPYSISARNAVQDKEKPNFIALEEVSGATKMASQYEFLRREVEIQHGLYDTTDQQLKQLQLSEDMKPSSVRVIERAETPGAPFSPNRRMNLMIGAFTGLFLGLFLAFFREYLDDTIKSAEEVQE